MPRLSQDIHSWNFRSLASAWSEKTAGEEDPPRTLQIARTKSKSKTRPVHDLPLFADYPSETETAPQTGSGPSLSDDDDTIIQFPGGVRV